MASRVSSGRLSPAHAALLKRGNLDNATAAAIYEAQSRLFKATFAEPRLLVGVNKVLLVGVPNGTPGTGSRLDSVLASHASASTVACPDVDFVHVRNAMKRTSKLPVPAKDRAPCLTTPAADAAAKEEAATMAVTSALTASVKAALAESPGEQLGVLIVDDTCATAITLRAAEEALLAGVKADVDLGDGAAARLTIVLGALTTRSGMAGTARGTLFTADSEARMATWLGTHLAKRHSGSETGFLVYVRELLVTRSELETLAQLAIDKKPSCPSLQAWGKSAAAIASAPTTGAAFTIKYVGQVHTHGKSAQMRWDEEDAGNDGTALLHHLAVMLASIRSEPEPAKYVSYVLLREAEIIRLADVGLTDLSTATDFAERTACQLLKTLWKEGSANAMLPGDWKCMPPAKRLLELINLLIAPSMTQEAARQFKVQVRQRLARDICDSNPALMTLIDIMSPLTEGAVDTFTVQDFFVACGQYSAEGPRRRSVTAPDCRCLGR